MSQFLPGQILHLEDKQVSTPKTAFLCTSWSHFHVELRKMGLVVNELMYEHEVEFIYKGHSKTKVD